MMSRSTSWRPARWESCGKMAKFKKTTFTEVSLRQIKMVIYGSHLKWWTLHPLSTRSWSPSVNGHSEVTTLLFTIIRFRSQRLFQRHVFSCLVLSLISKRVGCWLPSKKSYKRWEKWGRAFVCAHSPFTSPSHHARCLKPSTELLADQVKMWIKCLYRATTIHFTKERKTLTRIFSFWKMLKRNKKKQFISMSHLL